MRTIPTLAVLGIAALSGAPTVIPALPDAPPDPCALPTKHLDLVAGRADTPYGRLDETLAAIRVLDARPGRCAFGTTYALSRRLLASVWSRSEPHLRRQARRALVRAMRRAFREGPRDRVQMAGQVELALQMDYALLVTLPPPWLAPAQRWSNGWGPRAVEHPQWEGFMRSWLDL